MLGVYNYTVILTYIGMLTGFTGVTCAMQGNLKGSLIFLLIAGQCDMFDGKVASTKERTKKEKRFGVQIDSLSDLICFGVLPAVIVYSQSEHQGVNIHMVPANCRLLFAKYAVFFLLFPQLLRCSGPWYGGNMYARKESGVMQMRGLILFLIIVYVISPVDAYPGPIDDIVVIVLGEMLRRHLASYIWILRGAHTPEKAEYCLFIITSLHF